MVMVSAVEPERSCRHTTAFTTMTTTTLRAAVCVARADWGPAIKTTARAVAAIAVACYVAGYMLGAWVHRTSAALACYWVGWWRQSEPATPGADPGCLPPAPITPAVHPLAAIAGDLQSLPAARLRGLTGTRSKRARKADLAALLVAC
jgi:heme A synthase